MKTRKDMDKVLKQEAKLAAHSQCYAWSRLFLQCAYLLRKKDREIERLKAGGCARDQSTTQYCAEAAAMAAENERLRAALEGDT
jgi:hypothetical protein